MTDKVWLLTAGQYSSYHVVGAFSTEAEALSIRAQLENADSGYEDYAVEGTPILTDVRVEEVYTTLRRDFSIKWTGAIGYDDGDTTGTWRTRNEHPIRSVRVLGLPEEEDGDREVEMAPVCQVGVHAFESNYTLGVSLSVTGTDLERVAKVFSEQRAQLLAEPAVHVVKAWAERGSVPEWVWRRTENAGLLDALRQAGVA